MKNVKQVFILEFSEKIALLLTVSIRFSTWMHIFTHFTTHIFYNTNLNHLRT